MSSKSCKLMQRRFASATSALCREIFLALDTELSHKAAELLISRHDLLIGLDVNPSGYEDCETFRRDYLAVSLLSKYPYLELEVDREAVALKKFLLSEEWCAAANHRISSEVHGSIRSPYTPLSILSLARLKIASLLGPFSWDEAAQYFGFGPGASTALSHAQGDAYFKYEAVRPHTTEGNANLAWAALKYCPRWYENVLANRFRSATHSELMTPACYSWDRLFEVVPGNRIVTVPKSAKTDRVIAIEPCMNMYVQKGIGGVIRRRLKRVCVDLDSQLRNQELALEASINDTLATIDLSSASDSVSLELVRSLMPADWMDAIEQSRSPRGSLPDGTLITYQKVSSMGNGFTFELESLLFWAIASAVVDLFSPLDRRIAVYGDDIIVSSQIAGSLIWILDFCGFQTNKAKTFVKGPFRESCGKHYFRGCDVTPFYVRKDIKSPDRLFWLANSIKRWSRTSTYGLDPLLKSAYLATVSRLPLQLQKPTIPDGLGDIALAGDFDEVCPPRSSRYQSWLAKGYVEIKRNFDPDGVGRLLRSLSQLEMAAEPTWRGGGFPCGSSTYWKTLSLPVTQWEGFGPWLG